MPLPYEKFKVFISHATTPDGQLVHWISEALDRLHIRAFAYERYMVGGRNRFETIKAMITECPYFIVLLTTQGVISQWVNQEVGFAVARGKNPIPIIEANQISGLRIQSQGFVELHDPITYVPSREVELMADILYTFVALLKFEGLWRDLVYLSCACQHDFEGQLDFQTNWSTYTSTNQPFPLTWECKSCGRQVTLSFPDCHLIPQHLIPQ